MAWGSGLTAKQLSAGYETRASGSILCTAIERTKFWNWQAKNIGRTVRLKKIQLILVPGECNSCSVEAKQALLVRAIVAHRTSSWEDWPAITETVRTTESLIKETKVSTVLTSGPKVKIGIVGVHNAKASTKYEEKRTGRLQVAELKGAKREWLKSVQSDLKKQGNFKQLVSELDIEEDRGILRCEGRLVNWDLESEARKPIILPRQHRFIRLVVEECHQRVNHSGVRATLVELRSRFWVPKGRKIAKRILGECITCNI